MAKGPMSAAAKRKIAAAQRARWAKFRAEKAAGISGGARPGTTARRGRKPGRPAGTLATASMPTGGLLAHTTNDLIIMRRRIDQELADRLVRDYQTQS